MLTERYFHTGIVTLNYAEGAATGPPLVLLHGGSARWQSALPLIPDLSEQWHVYVPDLRGHGQSGHVPDSYRLKDYVADIVSFLEQVVEEPAILFGHSLGGHIAILVAAQYPHLVRGLLIGDAPFDYMRLRTALQRDQQRLLYWRDLAEFSSLIRRNQRKAQTNTYHRRRTTHSRSSEYILWRRASVVSRHGGELACA